MAPVRGGAAYIRVFGGAIAYQGWPQGGIHAYARLWGPTSLPMAQGLMPVRYQCGSPTTSTRESYCLGCQSARSLFCEKFEAKWQVDPGTASLDRYRLPVGLSSRGIAASAVRA